MHHTFFLEMFLFAQVLKVKARYGNKVLFRIKLHVDSPYTIWSKKYFGNKSDATNVN